MMTSHYLEPQPVRLNFSLTAAQFLAFLCVHNMIDPALPWHTTPPIMATLEIAQIGCLTQCKSANLLSASSPRREGLNRLRRQTLTSIKCFLCTDTTIQAVLFLLIMNLL